MLTSILILACSLFSPAAAAAPPAQKPVISYETFVELSANERRERFDKYDAETKSFLMRTHARKWLDKNRERLSTAQISLVNEAIDFLSPAAFSGTPEMHEKTRALLEKFKCGLRESDLAAAFRPDMTPSSRPLSDAWYWLWNCVFA